MACIRRVAPSAASCHLHSKECRRSCHSRCCNRASITAALESPSIGATVFGIPHTAAVPDAPSAAPTAPPTASPAASAGTAGS